MARRSPELVESEDDNAMSIDKEEKAVDDDGSDAGEDDGSEYEIEEILDAKRGAFPEVCRPPTALILVIVQE